MNFCRNNPSVGFMQIKQTEWGEESRLVFSGRDLFSRCCLVANERQHTCLGLQVCRLNANENVPRAGTRWAPTECAVRLHHGNTRLYGDGKLDIVERVKRGGGACLTPFPRVHNADASAGEPAAWGWLW